MDAGLVIVDKPAGLTSHDVVARLRRILRTRKIGHAGTLDPMATGVLVCGVERGTKLLGHLALDTKAYTATIRLGAATTTDDAEGEIVSTADAAGVTDAAIAAGVAALTGAIQQVPSSGERDQGRWPARLRARAGGGGGGAPGPAGRGVGVRRAGPPRRRPRCRVGRVLVGHVRARAGPRPRCALGVGGHLTALRRTRVGPFTLAHARTLEALEAAPSSVAHAGRGRGGGVPRRDADAGEAADLAHGRPLPPAGVEGIQGVFAPDGHVLALVRDRDGRARPVVVLAPA